MKHDGVTCSYKGIHRCEEDGNHYCGKHINKFRVKFPSLNHATKYGDCSICYCIMDASRTITPCNHAFHGTCLAKWKQTGAVTCPLCRGRLSTEDDPVAAKLKRNRSKYAGFQLWCIQKKLCKKLIHSPERNRYFFFKTATSLTLQEESVAVQAMTHDQAFESLMNLCLEHPNLLVDNQ